MMCGGDGTEDGSLLLVVSKSLSCEIRRSTLRHLEDDWGFDISMSRQKKLRRTENRRNYLAASRTALAVDDEVTFCDRLLVRYREIKMHENLRWTER